MVDAKEVREDVESFAEDLAGALKAPIEDESVEDESVEDEGGIFDEDLEAFDEDDPSSGVFVKDLEPFDEDAVSSDFDIGNAMLTTAAPVVSWGGQNLEEKMSREWVKKDWDDAEDAFSGNFYSGSSSGADAYGPKGSDAYSSGGGDRGGGVYAESSGGAYDAKGGTYDTDAAKVGMLKSHDQLRADQRGGSSILDFVGRDDKNKQKSSDFKRDFTAYEARDAA